MNDSTPLVVTQSAEAPYTQIATYKLTRACWFALYAPDAGRHDALLAEDLPAPYRTLFDAILDGSRGLARVAVEGGPALDLLDVVARLPRPAAIPTRRLELPDNPDLAAALFGKFAEALELGGGVGEWPAPPQHTCAAKAAVGTVLTFRPNRTQAARIFNPTWRTCPACLHQRAKRIGRQTLVTIQAVGAMTSATLSAADYRKWTARNRQHAHRGGAAVHYRGMPQEDGSVFVIATAGLAGAPVPTDRADLHRLIMAHCLTPEGRNCSSNRGFGGNWQCMKGDGRAAADDRAEAHERAQRLGEYREQKRLAGRGAVQRWTDSALEDVAAALDVAMKPDADRINVQIDHTEALERLHLAGIALRDKKRRKSVTHLVQSEPEGQDCTKSVTEDARGGQLRLLAYPTEHATTAKEGPPCAIYLP